MPSKHLESLPEKAVLKAKRGNGAIVGKPVRTCSARVAARNPMSRPAHRWSSARYGPMFSMMCNLSCTLCMSTHALRKQATNFQGIQENMAGRVYYGHHLTLSVPLQRNREARTSTKAGFSHYCKLLVNFTSKNSAFLVPTFY